MIKVPARELLGKLAFVDSGTHPKPFMPAISKVLLTVKDGVLSARSFNMQAHTMARVCDAEGVADGEIVVGMKRTVKNLKALKDNVVTVKFDWDAPALKFTCGRTRWNEQGENSDGFLLPPMGLPDLNEFPYNLSPAFQSASNAVDPSTAYDQLKGIRVVSNGSLEVVGTDGHSMAVFGLPVGIEGFEGGVTIPTESIDQLRAVFGQGSTKVGVSGKWFAAQSSDYFVATILGGETYPEYRKVLLTEEQAGASILVPRVDFTQAVSLAASYSDAETHAVILVVREISGEKVITVKGAGKLVTGSADADVPVICENDRLVMRLHHGRLTAALRSFTDDEEVEILLDSAEEPQRIVIRSTTPNVDHVIQIALMRVMEEVSL